jgi:hypothetical protein
VSDDFGDMRRNGTWAAEITALSGWVLKSMLLTKIRTTATVLLVIVGGILGAGGLGTRIWAMGQSHPQGKIVREECKAYEGQGQALGGSETHPVPPPPFRTESPPPPPSRSDGPDWPDADAAPALPEWPVEPVHPEIVPALPAIPLFHLTISFHQIEQRIAAMDTKKTDIKLMIIVGND